MKNRREKSIGFTRNGVLIACPVEALRGQWRRALENKFLVEETADWDGLEKSVIERRPSVLLLDLSLPEMDGIESVSLIGVLSPLTRILLLTDRPDREEAINALKAGAKGYSQREIDPLFLEKAVRAVQAGEIWVGRSVITSLLQELTLTTEFHRKASESESTSTLALLTHRERTIALLVGDGLSNREVSERLRISEKTVKAHLTSIFRKLDVSDRLHLALIISARRRSESYFPPALRKLPLNAARPILY